MVSTADPWPLVGRKEERHLINATIIGTGGFGGIVIAGPAGVGKSRLAREAITHVPPADGYHGGVRATTSARALPLGAFTAWAGGVATEPVVGHHYRASLKTGLAGRDDFGAIVTGNQHPASSWSPTGVADYATPPCAATAP
ncbi:AAA family ATPase [Rhodococcus opacus]|uniref:AAA family ATPase n=1 Tax=Rhodococcus opacus TaxID=37919 RepID=UPI000A4F1BBC|nr:AAA family ATPase [Rhodococcus opacus]